MLERDGLYGLLCVSIASWCNGSTRDSGSLCLGSNPSEAAKPSQNIPRRFSQNTRTQKALSRAPNAARARFVLAASIRGTRAEGKRAGKTSSARAKSERFSTGESGARVAEKPARQAKRFVAVSFNFYFVLSMPPCHHHPEKRPARF